MTRKPYEPPAITSMEGIPIRELYSLRLSHELDLTPLRGATVCIDFDGVIHSYTSGWTGGTVADAPEPGVAEFLRWLLTAGAEVVIFTTRGNEEAGVVAVRRWLTDNDLPMLPITATKPNYAAAFIDDRAISYRPGSGNWTAVARRLVHLLGNGPRVADPAEQEPRLGCATTEQLLDELDARFGTVEHGSASHYVQSMLIGVRSHLTTADLAYRTVGSL